MTINTLSSHLQDFTPDRLPAAETALRSRMARYPVSWQKLVAGDDRAEFCESVLRFALVSVLLSGVATGLFL